MSPRCLPAEPTFGEHRRAERTVWEALRDQLPDEAALFHSVALKERDQDFEADLVVAWPGVGVAVVEVKGGHITHEQGQWWQGDKNGRHKIDPVVQSQDCMHVLHRFLQSRNNPASGARSAYLVAFPHAAVSGDWEMPGCPRGLVIDKGDLGNAADIVRTAVEVYGTGSRGLDADALERLITILEGELGGQLSLLSAAEEHEQRVDQMTRDQLAILKVLRHQRRLKVSGGAGTGKTWLALEQARRLAKAGERVALVSYSRGLARFFQRVTAAWPKAERPAYVGLFHSLPLAWGADQPPPEDGAAARTEYYETSLPKQMGELAATLPDSEKFDSIVVDEGQDFGDVWWPPTLACLQDPETGGLFVFFDEAQRVFSRYGEIPIPLPPYELDENIRNTQNIAQVFGSLAGGQMRYRGLDGPPVRFMQCDPDAAIESADDAVEWLLEQGWSDGQIAVLTTGRRHYVQTPSTDEEWAAYWDAFFDSEEVFYGHVLGFKGLERPAVVLAVNGNRDPARAKEMLYVGLSRARTQLVVCGDLDMITEMGGPAVRIRLLSSKERAN